MADSNGENLSGDTHTPRHFAPKRVETEEAALNTRAGNTSDKAPTVGGAAAAKEGVAPKAGDSKSQGGSTPNVSSEAPSTDHEGLRRVKKKKHKALKRVAIVLGVIVGLCALAVGAVALWLGSLDASMRIDDEGERQALTEQLAPEPEQNSDPFYALVIGSDAREGDSTSRSDVTMLARIDPGSATIDLISIPRDTMVTLNGSTQKINAAYAQGGAAGAVACVSEFAGVPISHYVEVHFEELEHVVNRLGGVWVDVPESFDAGNGGMDFEAGEQLLNGEQALAYARERYNVSGGDFGRAQAQRQIVEAIIRQIFDRAPGEIPPLIGQLAESVSTDLSVTDLIGYAQQFIGQDITIYSAACPSYTLNQGGVSYVGTMFDEWRRIMQLVDAGLDPNDTTAEIPAEQAANEQLGSAANSAAPHDYYGLAQNAMTTEDVAH